MRSKALFVVGLGLAVAAALSACATPEAKAVCYPVSSWSMPVFRCATAAPPPPPPVVVNSPPPEPEPITPQPAVEPAPTAKLGGEKIELSETVQFETDSATLVERSKTLLDDVARELNEHPEVKRIQIEGHTDAKASKKYNMKLSQERVAAVKEYLVAKGIEPKRLVTKAFGETRPIASNKTEEGRAKNRRVDFRVLRK